MKRKINSFIKSHNLVNRVYDMVYYFGTIKDSADEQIVKKFFKDNLQNVEYVESLAKYFEKKLQKNYKNVELRYNLIDLVNDLNYLKQYIS
jgi:hypothetical protein